MPARSAKKKASIATESVDEAQQIQIAKAELEAQRVARQSLVNPHFELLERVKNMLPADSPDRRQISILYYLVNIATIEQAKSAVRRARWQVRRRPIVVAEMEAKAAAAAAKAVSTAA